MEDIYFNMKAQDLILNELVSFENGQLKLQGRRLVLHDMNAFAHLRRDSLQMLGPEHTRRILTRFAYFWGQEDAAMMQQLFTWDSLHDWLAAGPRLHSIQGVVRTVVKQLEDGEGDKPFRMKVVWYDSGEADEHLKAAGQADTPVCWMLAGYASGYASYCMGHPVYFIERKCRAKGDRVCTAEGRLEQDWGAEIKLHLPFFQPEDIHGRIKELTDQLRRQTHRLERERQKRREIESEKAPCFAEARSAAYRHVLDVARRVSRYDTIVLVTGETGVGKEVLARYIHQNSSRAKHGFLAINCAALPESLLESELFGHKAGAFTGASEDRVGMFEQASGGTLFLDEIGDISPAVQLRLLRALQEKEIIRVGESKTRKVDARVIAATNRNLTTAMQEGHFREDLYFRISVIEINVPPLRERPEDILPLARFFVGNVSKRLGISNLNVDPKCFDYLLSYSWPGNVRELENAIERAAVLSPGPKITPRYLPPEIQQKQGPPGSRGKGAGYTLKQLEERHIRHILDKTNGNRQESARMLGISPTTLWRRIKEMENPEKKTNP